jgi:Uma2 family endonuclease
MIMVSFPAGRPRYTYAEYLMLEEVSNIKHEFYRGEIYAMAGGTPEHAAIAVNVSTLLSVQLRGKPCRVHSSDLRVRVLATGLATYPDVTVVCGARELDPENPNTVVNPTILVEVLSPSSAEYDRGEKLEHYKQIASLREVVLVAHEERLIELWTRDPSGGWRRTEARAGRSVALDSMGVVLPVDEIFRDPLTESG